MNVKGLIYTVNEAKDFDRVRYFKIRHRRQHQRVIFPIETSWLPPLPKTGDLLDIEIPFAKVKDERFADWFMTRVAQLSFGCATSYHASRRYHVCTAGCCQQEFHERHRT